MPYNHSRVQEQLKNMSFEEKILRSDAEREVRSRLYAKGQYNPDKVTVQFFVNKAIKKLQEQHGSLNNVRHNTGMLDDMTPVVKKVISEIIKD